MNQEQLRNMILKAHHTLIVLQQKNSIEVKKLLLKIGQQSLRLRVYLQVHLAMNLGNFSSSRTKKYGKT